MEPRGPARVERRLAAILAADVTGYSRLMGADEEGTLARLKAHRNELIDPGIAERLEGLAEPGAICISEDAFRQVRGKIEAEFTDIGEQTLKNIARPVRVYRVRGGTATRNLLPVLPLPDKPSIAVLPFANMSG